MSEEEKQPKAADKESYLAKHAGWAGAAWGMVVSSILVAPVVAFVTGSRMNETASRALTSATTFAGAAIGYLMGKKSDEAKILKESKEAVVTPKPPSFFNRTLAKTWVLTNVITAAVGLVSRSVFKDNPTAQGGIATVTGIAALGAGIMAGVKGKAAMQEDVERVSAVNEERQQEIITKAVEEKISTMEPQQRPRPGFTQTETQRRTEAETNTAIAGPF